MVKILLNTGGIGVNPMDTQGRTPSVIATSNNFIEVENLLLSVHGRNHSTVDPVRVSTKPVTMVFWLMLFLMITTVYSMS